LDVSEWSHVRMYHGMFKGKVLKGGIVLDKGGGIGLRCAGFQKRNLRWLLFLAKCFHMADLTFGKCCHITGRAVQGCCVHNW